MKSFAELDIENNGDYLRLLSAVSRLSGLFTDSVVPLINYRVAENIFCKSFNAKNLSRSDTAFDANINSLGVGLKTFICNGNSSSEKVAEFNSQSKELQQFNGIDLAIKLSESRNQRIDLANRLFNINDSLYHIVARREKELLLFETDYDKIDINNINSVKSTKASLQFNDGHHQYSFNYSKSTLFRRFIIPKNVFKLPIEIIDDPYNLLLDLFEENRDLNLLSDNLIKGVNYVILPLYSTRTSEKVVGEKSGLNQWNAGGRKRNLSEAYIPVPVKIHQLYPNFFPPIEDEKNHFMLHLPNGQSFEASMCQTSIVEINGKKINKGKGLMTKSNKGLGDWILRKALQLKENEIVTMDMLKSIDIDSVIVIKEDDKNFKINVMKTNSYEEFIRIKTS
jgi:hypothetical protein